MDGGRNALRLAALGTSHWHDELRIYLAQFWTWGLLTPAHLAVDRRLPFSGKELGRRVAAHILASLFFTEIYFYLFTTMRARFWRYPVEFAAHLADLSAPRCWDGRSGAG